MNIFNFLHQMLVSDCASKVGKTNLPKEPLKSQQRSLVVLQK